MCFYWLRKIILGRAGGSGGAARRTLAVSSTHLPRQNFVQNKTMMEELQTLEKALGVLVCTFQRYCRKDGNQTTLSKGELRELLENELPSLRTLQIKDSAFEEMLGLLDTDKNGQVDFEEYIRFVAACCTFFHTFFQDCPAVQPRVQ